MTALAESPSRLVALLRHQPSLFAAGPYQKLVNKKLTPYPKALEPNKSIFLIIVKHHERLAIRKNHRYLAATMPNASTAAYTARSAGTIVQKATLSVFVCLALSASSEVQHFQNTTITSNEIRLQSPLFETLLTDNKVGALLSWVTGQIGVGEAVAAEWGMTRLPLAPSPLSSADTDRIRAAFTLQNRRDFDGADRKLQRLETQILRGTVLADRYLNPALGYTPSYSELRAWLLAYGDHPAATQIRKLAEAHKPSGPAVPALPPIPNKTISTGAGSTVRYDTPSRSLEALKPGSAEEGALLNRLTGYLRQNQLDQADATLQSADAKSLSPRHRAVATTAVAASFFFRGHDAKALGHLRHLQKETTSLPPMAFWIGGLAAWREGLWLEATRDFLSMAATGTLTDDDRAAAYFWAARSMDRMQRPAEADLAFAEAARSSKSFYGILALETLHDRASNSWTDTDKQARATLALQQSPAGQRALALIAVGKPDLAAAELAALPANDNPLLAHALAVYGAETGLTTPPSPLLTPLSRRALGKNALIPDFSPQGGFRVDRALLYAFMRQESRFQTDAVSHKGATGLMQLMPDTATFISNTPDDPTTTDQLMTPATNLSAGQRYLKHLMRLPEIGDNLMFVIAAYNAGPGKLARWRSQMPTITDPLLFLESLPARETRDHLENVLKNNWAYRIRLKQTPTTLTDLVNGEWPRYRGQD
jgi:soluble lytic murein transglycosylase